MKGFIRARLGFLQGRVRRACDASAECSALISPSSWIVNGRPAGVRRPFNCRFASEQQLAALCADAGLDSSGSSAPTRCKQASLGPVCVVDTDPCAREPCQNGGGCSVGIRESQNGDADACGCTPGLGWSGSAKACEVWHMARVTAYHKDTDSFDVTFLDKSKDQSVGLVVAPNVAMHEQGDKRIW